MTTILSFYPLLLLSQWLQWTFPIPGSYHLGNPPYENMCQGSLSIITALYIHRQSLIVNQKNVCWLCLFSINSKKLEAELLPIHLVRFTIAWGFLMAGDTPSSPFSRSFHETFQRAWGPASHLPDSSCEGDEGGLFFNRHVRFWWWLVDDYMIYMDIYIWFIWDNKDI